MTSPNSGLRFRGAIVIMSFLVMAAGALALQRDDTGGTLIPETLSHGEGEAATSAEDGQGLLSGPGAGSSSASRPAERQPWNLEPYRGLGAWVDVYDYAIRDKIDPSNTVAELSKRGVRTLYLQVARYKSEGDMADVAGVIEFLDEAAKHDIYVVGWYLPGFGDHERDLRRSLNVLSFTTPSGNGFDGLAIDIETREEVTVLGNPLATRNAFNSGIAEFSRRLRKEAPDAIVGAIVVDAKNNERAPDRWLGFPWRQISESYDVVMPMAYWSVTRGYNTPGCLAPEYDVASYMREVSARTKSMSGKSRPMHFIGGIADCVTPGEMEAFVDTSLQLGAIGGSVYDFQTTQVHSSREIFWKLLKRFNP